MADVRVEKLRYRYGRHPVLKGIDLTVSDGECRVLFGANGSGKSTLLSILATRRRPRHGSYLLDGAVVIDDPELARSRLLYLGHDSHLYTHLTPLENLRFFSDLRRLRPSDAQLLEVVEKAGLARFAHRPVRSFSAGMKKRLALSRTLLVQPRLLLLDEPDSALDQQGIDWLNTLLIDYLNQGGTVIMASHSPERVAALPYTGHRMENGILAQAVQSELLPC
ncbi:MAG: heme ABC exporter ATP-binding protein CcmA [Magnetococcales bacterium]|nr:heme ABC exporter ATP-binding protein CcmA [Magnetococcales bacterium]